MVSYGVVSRVSASISLTGALFVTVTFALFPRLRKPMNRPLFWASATNSVRYIFYIVGTAGLPKAPDYNMGVCRLQGFAINMLAWSALLFALAMALNVYLIFFRKWAPYELRKLEPWYLAIGLGGPFLNSLIFLIFDLAPTKSNIYGPANLWCWVTAEYQWIRMIFGYGLSWLVLAIIGIIYIAVGVKIVLQSRLLRKGKYGIDAPVTVLQVGNPFVPAANVVCVTEVQVTSTLVGSETPSLARMHTWEGRGEIKRQEHLGKKFVTEEISADVEIQAPASEQMSGNRMDEEEIHVVQGDVEAQQQQHVEPTSRHDDDQKEPHASHVSLPDLGMNGGEPETPRNLSGTTQHNINMPRRSGSVTPASRSIVSMNTDGGNFETAHTFYGRTVDGDPRIKNEKRERIMEPWRRLKLWPRKTGKADDSRDPRSAHAKRAAMAYMKMSVYVFLSQLIVWGPASMARVWLWVNDNYENTTLQTIQAALAPSQGFFDCIVYVAMSWSQCRTTVYDLHDSWRRRREKRPGRVTGGYESGPDDDESETMSRYSGMEQSPWPF